MTAGREPALGPALDVVLDAAAHRVLWRRLALGDRPVLLDVADHGDTLAARERLDAAAWMCLRDTALVGPGEGPEAVRPDLADALAVLRAPTRELDARIRTTVGGESRFVAARGDLVVAAHLDAHDGLHLRSVPGGDPVTLLVDALPAAAPLPGPPIDVPASAVLGTSDAAERARALRRAGVPGADRDRLAALWSAPPRRVIQVGAATRDGSGRRRRAPRPLTVVDAVAGRVVVTHTGGRVRFRPSECPRLRADVSRLLADVAP